MTITTTVAHTVTLRASGLEFPCDEGRTVLEAAEDAGLRFPYSCRKGVCSTCEGRLVRGEVDVRGRAVVGPASDVRFCQARPRGDVDVVPTRVERRGPPDRKRLPARVFAREQLAPGVTSLRLRFPIGRRAPFSAGQYLRVHLEGDSRNYSLANAPQDNDRAELHIRHVDGGRFSEEVLRGLAVDDVLDVEMPFGQFGVDENSSRPVVLVATGTGFAPMRSILLDHVRRRRERPVRLYWGARTPADLYLLEAARVWATRFPWFEVVPVVSARTRDWTGRTGLVHEAVLADLPDLSEHDVLTCGNPAMISAAGAAFRMRGGLPPEQYVADAFLPSGDHDAAA